MADFILMLYEKMVPTVFSWRHLAVSDLDRIQTCNLLSRNQMRYSVAPRGRL
jgi:hypothetical protein